MLYSEIFRSIQGEGIYTGVPTVWLRMFGCNLECNGFGQDDPTDPDSTGVDFASEPALKFRTPSSNKSAMMSSIFLPVASAIAWVSIRSACSLAVLALSESPSPPLDSKTEARPRQFDGSLPSLVVS